MLLSFFSPFFFVFGAPVLKKVISRFILKLRFCFEYSRTNLFLRRIWWKGTLFGTLKFFLLLVACHQISVNPDKSRNISGLVGFKKDLSLIKVRIRIWICSIICQ